MIEYQGIAVALAMATGDETPTGLLMLEKVDQHEYMLRLFDEKGQQIALFWLDSELLDTLIKVTEREG